MKLFESVFFYSSTIRCILDRKGDPWFVAKDVCDVLGYGLTSDAIRYLDNDEKGMSLQHTLGGMQKLSTIPESGLYTLIIRSNKPIAKPFRRWVTHEVLPSIRKDGIYIRPDADPVKVAEKTMEWIPSLTTRYRQDGEFLDY